MSSSHLEPVSLNDHHVQDGPVGERREVHVGSLGLGTALAVAYDIYGDTQLPVTLSGPISSQQQHNQPQNPQVYSTPQFTGFLPLANGVKTVGTMLSPFHSAAASFHYRQGHQQQCQPMQHSPSFSRQETVTTNNTVGSWGGIATNVYQPVSSLDSVAASSYLTPIPSLPSASTASQTNSHSNNTTSTGCPPAPVSTSSTTAVSSSASTLTSSTTTNNNGCPLVPCTNTDQQPVLSSSYAGPVLPPASSFSSASMSSTSSSTSSSSCPSTASPPSSTAFLAETNGGHQAHGYATSLATASGGLFCHKPQETSPPVAGSGGHQNASAEESLYEISDEELREIDASLTNSPDVMASRQWKYYIETNEWTRATCALMACLFTREQMANSTVLGRGGSQRARLPSNLVAYVVSIIRRRFNKPAAAVRARMAQKCKDERRFGRITISGGVLPDGSPTPVAALTGKFSSVSSSSNSSSAASSSSSRRSRKRPNASSSAGGCNGTNNSNSSSGSNRRCYSPSAGSQEEAGYQPTGALLSGLVDGKLSQGSEFAATNHHQQQQHSLSTDPGQLLPIPLSPSASLSQSSLLATNSNDLDESNNNGLAQLLFLPSSMVRVGGSSGVEPISSVLPPLVNPSSTVTG